MPEPSLFEFQNALTMVGKGLGLRHSDKLIPSLVSNVAQPVVPVYGTQPLENNLAFDSIVGDSGATFGVTPLVVPDGKVRYITAVEMSHNDAGASHSGQFGFQYNRAGGALTAIALVNNRTMAQFEVIALNHGAAVILPPGATLYFQFLTMNGARQVTLKTTFVDLPIGATFPR